MDACTRVKLTKLIEENTNGLKVTWIKDNLFLLDYKNKLELTSIWYRGKDCTFYGLNNKYLQSTETTFIIKEEVEGDVQKDKIYRIPSSFLIHLGITQDLENNRSVPNISKDKISLDDIEAHNISRFRIF